MSRVVFEDQRATQAIDPGRADVALFVGLARYVATAIPPSVQDWLKARGWTDGPYARPLDELMDVPVPIEAWTGFTALFDPGGSAASSGTDYLAAAVRSFFSQGGKRCYVVRMGDPVTAADDLNARHAVLDTLLPGADYRPDDPRSWHGFAHVGGLSDVSFLVLPDLPALTASRPSGAAGEIPITPSGPEQFVECAAADITPPQNRVYASPAPRLSLDDYGYWAGKMRGLLAQLSARFREVQLVAAMPLPQNADIASARQNPTAPDLAQDIHTVMATQMKETTGLVGSISSSFLQLGYPWLKTSGSHTLLESLEPPDGALAGILARNALIRGTYTSAVKVAPSEIFDLWPELPMEETRSSAVPLTWGDNSRKPLIERISLFGFTPEGIRLLSDVTTFAGETYRPGRVNRLVSVICRAARHLGEDAVFESNSDTLRARIRTYLQQLMTRLWTLNAFEGGSVREAFTVACDRSTTTQNDIDNGRAVAVVSFTAAATIELIRVSLAFGASGASVQEIAAATAGVV